MKMFAKTSQVSLFDLPQADTHRANIERVRTKIGPAVRAFIHQRILAGKYEFVITELHDYVTAACGGAPASPDRILRDGRQRGWFDYELVSRRKSLYRIIEKV